MIAYVDTSVALRFILEGDIAIHNAFEAPRTLASELLLIESRRVLERHRLNGEFDDAKLAEAVARLFDLYACFEVWGLGESIKKRAGGQFPTVVGTLDALHLATAIEALNGEADSILALFSYDRQMNLCAKALGFATPLL